MKILALDTNIILLDASNIFLSDTVFLAETVVDEIDSKKSGLSEIAYQAREFGRLLTKATKLPSETFTSNAFNITLKIAKYQLDNTTIMIGSISEYPKFSDEEISIRNDRKILYTLNKFMLYFTAKDDNTDFTFMTNDVMCRIRAESFGIPITDYKEVDKVSFDFIKQLSISAEHFSNIHLKPIIDIDPEYIYENHNYIFSTALSNQLKPAIILNGTIHVIGKTTEDELHRQDIPPLNLEQLLFARAINEPTLDVIICEALSGSGKTIVALSNAIKLVKSNSNYKSIIYIRNSIDDYGSPDEEIGFLAGNEEKLNVYLQPLWDTLDSIIRSNYKDSKFKGEVLESKIEEKRTELIEKCDIQGIIGLGLRGRTFDNAIIIIDEAQNIPKTTMQKMLTRVGKQSKVIIIGSNKQIDSRFLNKFTNGLSVILDDCSKNDNKSITTHAVTLNKVVRGNIAEWAETLFSY